MNSKLFQTTLFFSATIFLVSAQSGPTLNENLVPEFGVEREKNPQNGTCEGVNGSRISCDCPPLMPHFIEALKINVAARKAVNETKFNWALSFPSGDDNPSKIDRLSACIATILNIKGPNQGCPLNSTTYQMQLEELTSGPGNHSSMSSKPVQSSTLSVSPPTSIPSSILSFLISSMSSKPVQSSTLSVSLPTSIPSSMSSSLISSPTPVSFTVPNDLTSSTTSSPMPSMFTLG